MKLARIFVKSVFYICSLLSVFVFSALIYLGNSLENEYKIKKGNNFTVNTAMPVTAVYNGAKITQGSLDTVGEEYDVDLKLFGIIPLSTVNIQVVDEMQVAVLGSPFGMKLYTDGVLVIDITSVKTAKGLENPAKDAGIKKGDYIISVNGKNIYTNEDLSETVEKSEGKQMNFLIKRSNKKINLKLAAVKSEETGNYQIGIWIKDSSAGIGTFTFYSPAVGVVCGLGHGICDDDTGELLRLNSGELVTAEIIGIEKGDAGSPGKLEGRFGYKSIGKIDLNANSGIYSRYKGNLNLSRIMEIALKNEVKNGDGQILCTLSGDKPELYSCKINIRTAAFLSKTQNMTVTVTDKALLRKTGGIVQGMSGSPIIQDGRLVGAVTHVLVDDPTTGYAIFAENMLETAQKTANGTTESILKEAS